MEIDLIMVFAEIARGTRSEPRRMCAALRSHGISAVPLTVNELLETQVPKSTAVLLLCGREAITKELSAFLTRVGKQCLVSPLPRLLRTRRGAGTSGSGKLPKQAEITSLFAFAGVFSHSFRFLRGGSEESVVSERVPVYAATSELLVAHHALEASGANPLKAPIVRVDLARDRRGEVKAVRVDFAPATLDSDASPDSGSVIARAAEAVHRWRTANRMMSGKSRPRRASSRD